MQRSVGFTIADHVANVNGGMLVMSTLGRGRTETILGSVAVDVLREMLVRWSSSGQGPAQIALIFGAS